MSWRKREFSKLTATGRVKHSSSIHSRASQRTEEEEQREAGLFCELLCIHRHSPAQGQVLQTETAFNYRPVKQKTGFSWLAPSPDGRLAPREAKARVIQEEKVKWRDCFHP